MNGFKYLVNKCLINLLFCAVYISCVYAGKQKDRN